MLHLGGLKPKENKLHSDQQTVNCWWAWWVAGKLKGQEPLTQVTGLDLPGSVGRLERLKLNQNPITQRSNLVKGHPILTHEVRTSKNCS